MTFCRARGRRASIPCSVISVVVIGIVSLAACGVASRETASRQPEAAPDILVFMVDTLRADELGCYGADVTETPRIDAFALEGVLFERASSPSASTRPTVASLLTGVSPSVHGVHDLLGLLPGHEETELVRLASLLRDRGYHVAGLVANPNVDRAFGFDIHFDEYVGLYSARDGHNPAMSEDLVSNASTVVTRIERLLAGTPVEKPLFLFVLAIDPHAPYSPPATHARRYRPDAIPARDGSMRAVRKFDADLEQGKSVDVDLLRALYRGEVSFIDMWFGRLLDQLSRAGRLDRTLVVFTSDHGEEFLDHGQRGHGKSVYEEVTHVPLILRHPTLVSAGTRRSEEVDLLDLSTTLATAAGAEPPEYWIGRDLLNLPLSPRPVVSTNLVEGHAARAVRWNGHKLVQDLESGSSELYDLERDPGESSPISGRQSIQLLMDLRSRLEEFDLRASARHRDIYGADGAPRIEDVPRKLEERLRALGYVN